MATLDIGWYDVRQGEMERHTNMDHDRDKDRDRDKKKDRGKNKDKDRDRERNRDRDKDKERDKYDDSCSMPASNSSVGDFSVNSRQPLYLGGIGVGSSGMSEGSEEMRDEEIDMLFRKAGICREPKVGGLEGAADGGDDSSIASRGECRVGQCRLPCLQPCATIVMFTAMCCALAMLNGALTAGYVNSVITTIEKRFEIGSSYSGLIAASVEIGGVMSVVIVSYLGATRHIPNWIGFGTLITGIGTLVFTLPHMMAPAYTVTGGLNSSRHSENMCLSGSSRWIDEGPDDVSGTAGGANGDGCLSKESGQIGYVLTLVIAQMLIGIGGSPIYTLGTTYIDNHVSKLKAPSYIAFIYAFGVFGPILGFALGALMLQLYVDLFSFDSVTLNLSTGHPRWVGAWWAGFIFIGSLLFLVSIPFYGFPKMLVRALRQVVREDPQRLETLINAYKKKEYESDKDAVSFSKSVRDFPSAVCSILTNPVYLVTCLGICCEVSIVSGFVVFLPKYLETQFGSTKSMANLLTGGIAIPGAVVGILFGGYCMRQFQLSTKGAIQLTLVMNLIALASFGVFFCLGCDNLRMAGVTQSYNNSTNFTRSSGHKFAVNLTSSCNIDCQCDNNLMEPVCGINGLSYFSPCHAGCSRVNGPQLASYLQNYSSCSCITPVPHCSNTTDNIPTATAGICNAVCDTLIPFMVMLFIMTFFISGTQMPLLMITMRSVKEEEKAFALGIQFVMLRVFAYIPSPIMFGKCIDSTCTLWTDQCGYPGNCLIYDLELFRYKYVGMSFVLKSLAALFYLSIWLLLVRQHRAKLLKLAKEPDQKRVSVISVDKDSDRELKHIRSQWTNQLSVSAPTAAESTTF